MWIKLNEQKGPPLWFLGNPKQIKFSLNYVNPGPIDINFESLDINDQKKILLSIQARQIESDVNFQELYELYLKHKPAVAPPPPEVKQYLDNQKASEREDQLLKLEQRQKQKEEKFKKRLEYLKKLTSKALGAALDKEVDIRLLRTLLTAEENGKNRYSVTNLLKNKLRKIQGEIMEEIIQTTPSLEDKSPLLANTDKKLQQFDIQEENVVAVEVEVPAKE